jgi:hypothetical protein
VDYLLFCLCELLCCIKIMLYQMFVFEREGRERDIL